MKPETRPPDEWSANERENFIKLVIAGGAVSEAAVRDGIKRATLLAMIFDRHGTIMGAGALKQPLPAYRGGVFKSAQSILADADFPLELGYVCVSVLCRGRGLSHDVSSALLSHVTGTRLFATTRLDRPAMQRTLEVAGFRREGNAYASGEGAYFLGLFIRDASA